MREVLADVEAAKVKTRASWPRCGYSGYLLPEDIEGSDYILALEVDGRPSVSGSKGRLFVNTRKDGEGPGMTIAVAMFGAWSIAAPVTAPAERTARTSRRGVIREEGMMKAGCSALSAVRGYTICPDFRMCARSESRSWGDPSAALRIGDIGGLLIALLSRHDEVASAISDDDQPRQY